MNYGKAQSELKSKFPIVYHKYSFNGEIRTYVNKQTLIGENVKYRGTTTRFVDHWAVKIKNPLAPNPNYDNGSALQKGVPLQQSIIGKKSKSKIDGGDGHGFDGPIYDNIIPEKLIILGQKNKRKYPIRSNDDAAYERHGGSKSERVHIKPAYKETPSYKELIKKNLIDGMFNCCYCNISLTKDNYAREHIIPVSRGGSNELYNLKPCCYDCNYEKGNLMLHSYIQLLCLNQAEMKPGTDEYKITQTKIINANKLAIEIGKA